MAQYKKLPLDKKDIETLKYQCRPGILFPAMILTLGVVIILVVSFLNPGLFYLANINFKWPLIGILFILALLMNYAMTRKFRADVKSKTKNMVLRPIQKLEEVKDFEAGSGDLYVGQEMQSHKTYYVIVDNIRHRINKEVFDVLEFNGKVALHYAPVSNYLIKIDRPE